MLLRTALARTECRIGIRSLASVSEKTPTHIERLHNLRKDAIEQGREHFRVGGRKIYFPTVRITLLRPNAKHDPYQAKFTVPRSFNKLDLRDYLYHVYGLRALKITTQLIYGKYIKTLPMTTSPRHRLPQVKKMTISMLEPFIWPSDEASAAVMKRNKEIEVQSMQYSQDKNAQGSDKLKRSKAFGGIVDPFPSATNFIPKKINREMSNSKLRDLSTAKKSEGFDLIRKHLTHL